MKSGTSRRHLAGAELWHGWTTSVDGTTSLPICARTRPSGPGRHPPAPPSMPPRPTVPDRTRPRPPRRWPWFPAGRTANHSAPRFARTDVGLQFCRRCPEELAARVLATGRASHGACRAGGTLLGFPAPRGSRTTRGILRVGPPSPRDAAAVFGSDQGLDGRSPAGARQAAAPERPAALAAARVLRDPPPLRVADPAAHPWFRTGAGPPPRRWRRWCHERGILRAVPGVPAPAPRTRAETSAGSTGSPARPAGQRPRTGQDRASIHDTAAQSMVSAFRFLDAARAYAQSHPATRSTSTWSRPPIAW